MYSSFPVNVQIPYEIIINTQGTFRYNTTQVNMKINICILLTAPAADSQRITNFELGISYFMNVYLL